MRVAILAFDGCLASGVSGFMDALKVGNLGAGRDVFTFSVLGAGSDQVVGFGGTPVPVDGRIGPRGASSSGWDVVYVPPAFRQAGGLDEMIAWVGRAHETGAVACAACAGVFVLAGAGILTGREATTHWALAGEFARLYPDVRLDIGRILVDGGDYICAGGVTAYFDLALRLMARFVSPEVAAKAASTLLVDPGRSSQTPYMSLLATTPVSDEAVDRARKILERNIHDPPSIKELAASVHVSERTLLRRFRSTTGRAPGEYLQALRVEQAKRLLAATGLPVAEVAAQSGYQDATAFHRLFKQMAGITPGEYRRRFTCFQEARPEKGGPEVGNSTS